MPASQTSEPLLLLPLPPELAVVRRNVVAPLREVLHAVPPSAHNDLPATHGVQSVDPAMALYLPGAHFVQSINGT